MTEDHEAAEVARGLGADHRWVPGYEGRYCVDADGIVYSVARTFFRMNRGRPQIVRVPGGVLHQCLNRNGYPFVCLYRENKGRTFEVHRLICRAFHGEPSAEAEAAHIDGVKTNCRSTNLEWKSRAENMADKKRHGTHHVGENVHTAKLDAPGAISIYNKARSGGICRAIAREYGVSEGLVRKIRDGKVWSHVTRPLRAHLQGETA